ncbi:MAG: DUF4255 domain-containing protein [Cyanobacteria bacterium P01_A01_bin.114]
MSNHLAIATVTATLQRTLQASVQNHVEGARITTVSPSEIGKGTPETGVNIFMYQVISNPALHNIDATPLRTRGTPVKRQAALDLYYMLSFYGNNNELAPQRLLGSVVRTLNDKRVITQAMIREACNDTTFSFLRESNLADQVQKINIMPLDLNLEDLSKTWSVFFQTPYILSVAYKSLVVLVEGDEVYKRALPVRDYRANGFAPFPAEPKIDRIIAATGQDKAIVAESTLLIQGKQLKGDRYTQVRLGGIEVTPAEVTPTEIELSLATLPQYALRAGVQSLQVIHPQALTTVERPHGRRGVESDAAPFVLRPRVMAVEVTDIEETDDDLRNALIAVQVNLTVGAQQPVVLALNEWSTDSPATYMFDIPRREQDSHTVSIPIQAVKPGEYLVRLLVDGAESQLQIDTDQDSPTYEWYVGPKVLVL